MFEKRSIYALLIEFVLIISGILISLFFQSRFEANLQREEGLQIIDQVYNDLKLDTALFNKNIRQADYLMNEYTNLLSKKDKPIVEAELPEIVKGVLATDSKILTILNRGGYLRFTSFGNYELYDDPTLINSILHYYNNQNELLSNYYHWDASYIEEKVVGYYLANHNVNLRRYFEQSILKEAPKKEDALMMQAMLHDENFQSIQVYNFIIKQNYKAQLEVARNEATNLLNQLEKYMKEKR